MLWISVMTLAWKNILVILANSASVLGKQVRMCQAQSLGLFTISISFLLALWVVKGEALKVPVGSTSWTDSSWVVFLFFPGFSVLQSSDCLSLGIEIIMCVFNCGWTLMDRTSSMFISHNLSCHLSPGNWSQCCDF